MKPGRIFIHHDGALGDTLLSLPCIDMIRESAYSIHIAGRWDVVHFLKQAGLADEISSADSSLYSCLYAGSLDETMRSFFSGFDMSFVFTANVESKLVSTLRGIIPTTRAIRTIPPADTIEHIAEFRIKQLQYGRDAVQRRITLSIPDNEATWAAGFLREQGYSAAGHCLVAVHPGSGSTSKNWPLDNYAALLRYFMIYPDTVFALITGPAEDAAVVSDHLLSGGRSIFLRHESLMRVAALLSQADFYVGNDSGISHLAGILGCRGAVLFGPTDPSIWRPQGKTLDVVRFSGPATDAAPEIMSRFKSVIHAWKRADITQQGFRKTSGADAE